MNVKELKTLLDTFPEDLEVWAACEGYGNVFPLKESEVHIEMETMYRSIPPKEVLTIITGRS